MRPFRFDLDSLPARLAEVLEVAEAGLVSMRRRGCRCDFPPGTSRAPIQTAFLSAAQAGLDGSGDHLL